MKLTKEENQLKYDHAINHLLMMVVESNDAMGATAYNGLVGLCTSMFSCGLDNGIPLNSITEKQKNRIVKKFANEAIIPLIKIKTTHACGKKNKLGW